MATKSPQSVPSVTLPPGLRRPTCADQRPREQRRSTITFSWRSSSVQASNLSGDWINRRIPISSPDAAISA